MLAGIFLFEDRRPELLAFGIDAHQSIFAILRGRDVDLAIEMDWGRAPLTWQGCRPSEYILREARGKVSCFNGTGILGATPRGPGTEFFAIDV